jgi:26S proteasome regulatory subunit T4
MRSADYEAIVKLTDGFNGADLRNVCTEAGPYLSAASLPTIHLFCSGPEGMCLVCFVAHATGMFAIRAEREFVLEEDFMKAARKLQEVKKLEGVLNYEKV